MIISCIKDVFLLCSLNLHFIFPLLRETGERGERVGDGVHPDVPHLFRLSHQVQLLRVAFGLEDDRECGVGTESIQSLNMEVCIKYQV